MKIGYFTDTYFPQINGVTTTIAEWKKELEKLGEEVYVFYPRGSGYVQFKNEFGVPSLGLPPYKGYRIAIPIGAMNKAKELNLDIVHIHSQFMMGWFGRRVSKRLKVLRIFSYHTPGEMYAKYVSRKKVVMSVLKKLYILWERRLLNSCDVVIVPTAATKKFLEAKRILNTKILSNGVDTSHFKKINANSFKSELNLWGKVIGYCGRIGYEKRIGDLINLAPAFDGTILIAGSGPHVEHYKKMASIYKNIRFLGFIQRKKLPEFYSALDFFIFPSVVETQGKVALEAMACGVPVIGAYALALKDTIQDGETGYWFEPGNTKEMLYKIELGYRNRKFLSKKSLAFARENSVQKTAQKLLKIYSDLA